jgi:hypothetical protein
MPAFHDLFAWLLAWRAAPPPRPPTLFYVAASQAFVAGGDAQQAFVN